MSAKFVKLQNYNGKIELHGEKSALLGERDDVFVAWNFDGETLLVENDSSGCRPLFYFERGGEIAVSESLVKLLELGAPPDFDYPALAVFLRLGYFIGEDTPFRRIKQLPPGAKLVWQRDRFDLTSRGYLKVPPSSLNRAETVERYAELFRQAVARRLPAQNNYALPLSSGRDSRWILFELLRLDLQPRECLTLKHFPPRANVDLQIASQLCRELELKQTVLEQPDSALEPELKKNLLTHFCADEHFWYLPLADYIQNRFKVIYDGLAGDVLCGETAFTDADLQTLHRCFEQPDLRRAAQVMLDEGYLPILLKKDFYRLVNREIAIERLCREFEKHLGVANSLLSFTFYNRTRREVALAPFSILNQQTTVIAPFLDADFVRFALSVSHKIGSRAKMRESAINLRFPDLAHIPYEDKNVPDEPDRRFSQRYALELLRFARPENNSQFVRRAFWLPRLMRSLFDGNYGRSIASFGVQITYLIQLERLLQDLDGR